MVDISNNSWSPTDASNIQPSPTGWPNNTLFSQAEPIGRATMGGIKRWWERSGPAITTTGSANAYVYTPTNVTYPSAYVKGDVYSAIANFTNTGAATLNVNGLGAKSIYMPTSAGPAALVGGEIQNTQEFQVGYDGTQFQLLSPAANLAPSASTVWTPGFIGFSVDPTVTATYQKIGKLCFVYLFNVASGTSNSTDFQITTIPFTSAGTAVVGTCVAQDAGTIVMSEFYLGPGNTSITVTKGTGAPTVGNNWTNSGSKGVNLSFFYETV